MTYNTSTEMAQSSSLVQRIAACAAEQGIADPQAWAYANALKLASDAQFNWVAAWESGLASNQPGADTGAREEVITDQMILTAVQNYKAAAESASSGGASA